MYIHAHWYLHIYIYIYIYTYTHRVGLSRISSPVPVSHWVTVSDVTFVTFFGDKKCDASHLSHFWEECDALAHVFFFKYSRFLSHPSQKTSNFGPASTILFWTVRNVTIWLWLKHVFLLPSQICHLSRKREAGRPFGLRPTLICIYTRTCTHVDVTFSL